MIEEGHAQLFKIVSMHVKLCKSLENS